MHSSVVNYDVGAAIVLRPSSEEADLLEIALVPLADLLGQTLELIGDNVNGNPYRLGHSIHLLVAHGTLPVKNPPPLNFQQIYSWFEGSSEGQVEGIVFHCHDGTMFKVHREHLKQSWRDVRNTYLGSRPVVINVNSEGVQVQEERQGKITDMLSAFSRLHGRRFPRLRDICI